MIDRDRVSYPHIVLRRIGVGSERFIPFGRGNPNYPKPIGDRPAHARSLRENLEEVRERMEGLRSGQREAGVPDAKTGLVLAVDGRHNERIFAGDIKASSPGLSLLTLRRGTKAPDRATYFLGRKSAETLSKQLNAYERWRVGNQKPNRFYMFESIAALRPAEAEDLWASDRNEPPPEQRVRCEVWIKRDRVEFFKRALQELDLAAQIRETRFVDHCVVNLDVSADEVDAILALSASVVEFKAASDLVAGLVPGPTFTADKYQGLISQLLAPPADAPRTVLLDTGVNRNNPLLAKFLPAQRCRTIHADWGSSDQVGHGTMMAGVALHGDIRSIDDGTTPTAALESVKVMRPSSSAVLGTPHEDLRSAVDIVEATDDVRRVFCLAATIPDELTNGAATAASATIDHLAWNGGENGRLFCVAAGNLPLDTLHEGYASRNEAFAIETPGQAVNALTVGACTFMQAEAPEAMLAPHGDLSPRSRTARKWKERRPANKPDVVFEGGNLLVDKDGSPMDHTSASRVLTTSHANHPLALTGDTSAATAAVARLATRLLAQYPDLRAETVRGLIVNSASWSDAMKALATVRSAKATGATEAEGWGPVLDCFGWGVPDEARLRRSSENALTLIVEDELLPFQRRDGRTVLNELKYFALPWPCDALRRLRNERVELRCTLSYFVEPDPLGDRRDRRDRYASHRLRFRLNQENDTPVTAQARINKLVELGDESAIGIDDANEWTIERRRGDLGTLHHNIWRGPAYKLAERGGVCVYPVKGWWASKSDKAYFETRTPFSLIVTIATERTDVKLFSEARIHADNMVHAAVIEP